MSTSSLDVSKPDGSSFTTGLSSDGGCGPVQYLPLTGLVDNLENVYRDLQDAAEINAKAFLKSVVSEPGIRVSDNEFDCNVRGDVLEVLLGSVVFYNYNLFVPSSGITKAKVVLPDVTGYSEGDTLYVVLHDETYNDHPYPVVPLDGATTTSDAAQHDAMSIKIQDTYLSTDIVPAELEVSGGYWTVNDWRHKYMLKLLPGGRKVAPDQAPIWGNKVTNVEASTINMSDFKQSSVDINQVTGVINTQSEVTSTGLRSLITVSWDAPSEDEIALWGGIACYKVVLIPTYADSFSEGVIVGEAPYPSMALEAYVYYGVNDSDSRIGTSVPVTPGVIYKIQVYRLNDNLEQIPTEPSDVIYCVAGMTSQEDIVVSAELGFDVSVTPIGDPNTLKIHYNPETADVNTHYSQIFIKEHVSWPSSPSTSGEVSMLRYLFYEGPIKDVYYRISDSSTGVSIVPRLIRKEGNIVSSPGSIPIMYRVISASVEASSLPPFEIPLIISANNLDVGILGPGGGAIGFNTIYDSAIHKESYISRMIATVPHGVDNTLGALANNEGLWYPETYVGGTPSYVGDHGYIRIYVNGVLEATVKYDSTGRCEKEFATPIHIPANADLKISVGIDLGVSYPFGMNIILYLFGSWRQV